MEWLSLANRVIRRSLKTVGVKSLTARIAGADVHYYHARRDGRGPPLMLVHGLGSSANAFFRTLVPLARTFSDVYALDLPGNGFSPTPAAGPLKLTDHLQLIVTFQQTIVRQPVFMIGNSLGGGMVMNLAFTCPEIFRALGLVSPAGARVSDERFEQLLDSFRVKNVADARVLAHKLFHRPPLPLLFFADELRKMVTTDTVKSIVREVSPADMVKPEQLRALAMPTLLIWGQSEKLLPYEGLEFFRAHLPPHAEVHEVKGFGHMPQMESPTAFVERVTKFAHARGLVHA